MVVILISEDAQNSIAVSITGISDNVYQSHCPVYMRGIAGRMLCRNRSNYRAVDAAIDLGSFESRRRPPSSFFLPFSSSVTGTQVPFDLFPGCMRRQYLLCVATLNELMRLILSWPRWCYYSEVPASASEEIIAQVCCRRILASDRVELFLVG
jgi:hypothetical protein